MGNVQHNPGPAMLPCWQSLPNEIVYKIIHYVALMRAEENRWLNIELGSVIVPFGLNSLIAFRRLLTTDKKFEEITRDIITPKVWHELHEQARIKARPPNRINFILASEVFSYCQEKHKPFLAYFRKHFNHVRHLNVATYMRNNHM